MEEERVNTGKSTEMELKVIIMTMMMISLSFPIFYSLFFYASKQCTFSPELRILLKQNTALLSTFRPSVCVCVIGVTSPISHIYKGKNAILIIRGPIKPYIFWIKIILAIFLAKTTPDKTIFSALTNLTIYFDWSKELSKR